MMTEISIRLFSAPHEYLAPELETNKAFGYKIQPNKNGHDEWGFRNRRVPKKVDIVAIGDSFTYGISNQASDAWPAVLSQVSGRTVYNLSVGGYGVNQYLLLLKQYALNLQPKHVILGVYLGDDVMRPMKAESLSDDNSKVRSTASQGKLARARQRLAAHSVLYNKLVLSWFGDVIRYIESWMFTAKINSANYVYFNHQNTRTIFTPQHRLNNLDVKSEQVQQGLELTVLKLLEMKKICNQNNIKFSVILFPTKEKVYEQQLRKASTVDLPKSFQQLFVSEDVVRKTIENALAVGNIDFVNMRPTLSAASYKIPLFNEDANGHMNRNGHKITADSAYTDLLKADINNDMTIIREDFEQ